MNPFPYSILIGNHRRLKTTLPPKLPSAAELAAGDFLHLRRPYDYRSDHLGPLNPLVASAFQTEPPFAGDDRRSPAPLGQRRETTRATGQT